MSWKHYCLTTGTLHTLACLETKLLNFWGAFPICLPSYNVHAITVASPLEFGLQQPQRPAWVLQTIREYCPSSRCSHCLFVSLHQSAGGRNWRQHVSKSPQFCNIGRFSTRDVLFGVYYFTFSHAMYINEAVMASWFPSLDDIVHAHVVTASTGSWRGHHKWYLVLVCSD
jgi:hypothetical protein